jgi:hypothetical protein
VAGSTGLEPAASGVTGANARSKVGRFFPSFRTIRTLLRPGVTRADMARHTSACETGTRTGTPQSRRNLTAHGPANVHYRSQGESTLKPRHATRLVRCSVASASRHLFHLRHRPLGRAGVAHFYLDSGVALEPPTHRGVRVELFNPTRPCTRASTLLENGHAALANAPPQMRR